MKIIDDIKEIFSFNENRKWRVLAHNLYVVIVADARNPVIFERCKIADSVDGRFDMIVLHLSLFLNRLKFARASADDIYFERLSKEIIGVFNNDMDRNLREMGVGDLSVGKHVKKMAKAFYGRLFSYDQALEKWHTENDDTALREALSRNIYRIEGLSENLDPLMAYIKSYENHLKDIEVEDLKQGLKQPFCYNAPK